MKTKSDQLFLMLELTVCMKKLLLVKDFLYQFNKLFYTLQMFKHFSDVGSPARTDGPCGCYVGIPALSLL